VHAFRRLLSVIDPSGNASAAATRRRSGVSGLMLSSSGSGFAIGPRRRLRGCVAGTSSGTSTMPSFAFGCADGALSSGIEHVFGCVASLT
jgi:hypothetical protein